MSAAIQIVMLSFACLIVLLCRPPVDQILSGSVFRAGALAIVCAFGLAWMSETFVSSHIDLIKSEVQVLLQEHTWLIAIMMFFVSAMVSSQAATTLILLPLGLALGLPAYALIGSWPAVNGYFFIPVAGQCLAALAFDDTGTTRIGKYVLNHSFYAARPGKRDGFRGDGPDDWQTGVRLMLLPGPLIPGAVFYRLARQSCAKTQCLLTEVHYGAIPHPATILAQRGAALARSA
ncbi:anaerobic C4-dicarboxylate transporter [Atlantibacter hermannii]|nr:anaerobic C4-dicarboxylate transporter [Atlantibacter hermannii]